MNTKDLIRKARSAYSREGLSYLFKNGSKLCFFLIKNGIILGYYRIFRSKDIFEFNGNKYHYFYSLYGATWRSERAVEIPIVWNYVDKSRKEQKKILEVGNVLSYRFNVSHDILDKYDRIVGLINEDVVDYNPPYKYDLIVSISTLEHVGFDEELKDPMKIIAALQNLKRLLSSKGKLVVTLPLGQNIEMDRLIANKILVFDEIFYMKRIKRNIWKQVKDIDSTTVVYNEGIPSANAIMVGISEC